MEFPHQVSFFYTVAVLCLPVLSFHLMCVNQPDWEKQHTVIAVYCIFVTANIDLSSFKERRWAETLTQDTYTVSKGRRVKQLKAT